MSPGTDVGGSPRSAASADLIATVKYRKPAMKTKSLKLGAMALATLTMLGAARGKAQEKLAEGEVKDIAEEAFVYGFPMVMNYGVVYESFIDKSSSQYKCSFNQLYNS